MTPKQSIYLHLVLTLVAAALVGGAAWAETQSRQRHAQLAQSLRELEAEVAWNYPSPALLASHLAALPQPVARAPHEKVPA